MVRVSLIGLPGSGKTTVVKSFIQRYPGEVLGFYTEEIRERGKRAGFSIKTTWGDEAVFSHISIDSPLRVSRYGVDVGALERVLEEIEKRWYGELLVVDEVGKMELFSKRFRAFMEKVLDGGFRFLVTIPERSRDSLVLRVKRESEVLRVTRERSLDIVDDLLRRFFQGENRGG